MTLPSFTRRDFLVPAFFLATLVGFSQANEASAQSLQGTWEFVITDENGSTVSTFQVEVDRNAKSFFWFDSLFTLAEAGGLKINPAKNTFAGFYAYWYSPINPENDPDFGGFDLSGTADLDVGRITGTAKFYGSSLSSVPEYDFVGSRQ